MDPCHVGKEGGPCLATKLSKNLHSSHIVSATHFGTWLVGHV